MTILLDSNVLIALAVAEHVHHPVAARWFAQRSEGFATCPISQGALIRLAVRNGAAAHQAQTVLAGFTAHRDHEFWPDDLDYGQLSLNSVIGHRQVTDAYLAGLARQRNGWLATLDRGLGALHSDVAVLIGN